MINLTNNETEPRLLVIDDNLSIHEDFKKILLPAEQTKEETSELGHILFEETKNKINLPKYRIDFASQGEAGLELVKKQGESPYSIAFVDIRMPPGWDGIETISQIWKVDRRIQMVICTAYSDYSWEETVSQLGENDNLIILKKPFDIVEVRQIAFSLAEKWRKSEIVVDKVNNLIELVAERAEKLDHLLALLRTTLESTGDGIIVSDNEGKIIDYNTKFIEMYHIPESVLALSNYNKVIEYIEKNLKVPNDFIGRTKAIYNKEDLESFDEIYFKDERIFERYSFPHRVRNKIVGRVWNYRDVTQYNKMQFLLREQGKFDYLTDLPSRVLLDARFKQAIINAKEYGRILGVLFLDLDRIKIINDSLGHDIGDLFLKAVARRLVAVVSETDTVCRVGGDEFVFLITSQKSLEDIFSLMEKLLNTIKQPFQIDENELLVTGSIGCSIYPEDGFERAELLKKANSAMYRAKALGRNNFQRYTSDMLKGSKNKITLESDLRKAIQNNELILFYQPMVDFITAKIVGVEALVRWNHPVLGFLPPVEFISVAEESDLISSLGEWVLFEACRQNKAWQNDHLKPIIVAVNLSGEQFKKQKMDELVEKVLKETQMKAEYLALEVTESIIIQNTESVLVVMKRLKKMGISLCIDDFGTGYSSLSYLKKFPFDTLKIDRSFVEDLHVEEESKRIVVAIISMAKSLNLKIVAEGIEKNEQFDFLKANNCDTSQGFLFSKPVEAKAIERMLKQISS